ncbi:hypothetical protein [Kitasatospora azatica]|uniref:hypothetical protein n=1 Tax=Kitasatospora azatica TaxID=58347 RepID=UPI0005607C52|nr:hypothetical protein [Kitasatospora azatica]
MIVRLRPLSGSLVQQLAELARAGWDHPSVDGFLAGLGWDESSWNGYDTASGHQLVPGDPDRLGSGQSRFYLPFCFFDPSDEADVGPLGDEFEMVGWDGLDGDPAAFDQAWLAACSTVATELGAAETTLRWSLDPRPWNFAGWRVGARALIVAQGEEFGSYGELDMAAVWLVDLAPDLAFPDASGFYSWMLGEN